MTSEYLGYIIVCHEEEAWDRSFKSNRLRVVKPADPRTGVPAQTLVCMWWPSKMKNGIKEGIKLVDKHVKAMTILNGKG